MPYIPHEKPIAVYNTEQKEVIGLFASPSIVSKYLYGRTDCVKTSKVCTYLRQKRNLRDTIFSFHVALRYVNEAQLNVIGDQDFIITDGYPEINYKAIQGFHSTRKSLAEDALIKTKKAWEDKKNVQ